jgi:hypothetical protein
MNDDKIILFAVGVEGILVSLGIAVVRDCLISLSEQPPSKPRGQAARKSCFLDTFSKKTWRTWLLGSLAVGFSKSL